MKLSTSQHLIMLILTLLRPCFAFKQMPFLLKEKRLKPGAFRRLVGLTRSQNRTSTKDDFCQEPFIKNN